jgi:hypothetical protein
MPKRQALLSALGILAMIPLGSCATGAPASEQTVILAKLGFVDSYSSVDRRVTVKMCSKDPVSGAATLSERELDRIGKLAYEHGFFSLPGEIRAPPPRIVVGEDGEEYAEVRVISPCSASSLEIAYRGRTHKIVWSCMSDIRGRPEIAAITRAVAPYIAKLPSTDCRYY